MLKCLCGGFGVRSFASRGITGESCHSSISRSDNALGVSEPNSSSAVSYSWSWMEDAVSVAMERMGGRVGGVWRGG